MKFENIIHYLLKPSKLIDLYAVYSINPESASIGIYMENSLDINSNIELFEIEETGGRIENVKNNRKYIAVLPVDLAIELIDYDLDLKDKGLTDLQIAQRLLDYSINDA